MVHPLVLLTVLTPMALIGATVEVQYIIYSEKPRHVAFANQSGVVWLIKSRIMQSELRKLRKYCSKARIFPIWLVC